MDTATKDWIVVGCSLVSLSASLSLPFVTSFLSTLRSRAGDGRSLRRDSYSAIVGFAAQAGERFMSAGIRQKLYRQRPENTEISTGVDEDLGAGWMALEEMRKKLQADQLVCSDKILALVHDADKYFWSIESVFKAYGHTAIDIDDLHTRARDLIAKLKIRCRREIGLGSQR